ncbi:IMPACT family protein, partial [Psychrobacter sp. 1U2]
MSYHTLQKAITARLEIKKSEFITYAYPVTTREQAMFHVEQLREQYPDARH